MGRGMYLRSCFIGELEVLEKKNSLKYLGDGEERIVSSRSFYIASSRAA